MADNTTGKKTRSARSTKAFGLAVATAVAATPAAGCGSAEPAPNPTPGAQVPTTQTAPEVMTAAPEVTAATQAQTGAQDTPPGGAANDELDAGVDSSKYPSGVRG